MARARSLPSPFPPEALNFTVMEPETGPGPVVESDLEPWLDGLSAIEGLLGRPTDDLAISGLLGASPAYALAALYREKPGRWLIVCPELSDAESLCDDLDSWRVGKVHYLPELEILPFDRKSPTRDIQASIQAGLHALDSGEDGFFVTTIYGLRHKVMGPETLAKARLELRTGEEVDTDELGERLAGLGYRPAGVVEQPGDMAIRGGLIDIFSPAHPLPMRLELFGDEIESVRLFEPTDQRSRDTLDSALVLPAGPLFVDDDTLLEALANVEQDREVTEDDRTELIERLQDRLHFAGIEGLAPFFHRQVSLLEYFRDDDTLVFLAPDDLARRNEVLDDEIGRVRQDRIKRGDPVPQATDLVADTKELSKLAQENRKIWVGDIVLAGNCPTPLGPPASCSSRAARPTTARVRSDRPRPREDS